MTAYNNPILEQYATMHAWGDENQALYRMENSLLGTLLVVPPLIEKTFLRLDGKELMTKTGGQLLYVLHDLYAHKKDPTFALIIYKLEALYGPMKVTYGTYRQKQGNWFEYLGELMDHADPIDETIDDYVEILRTEYTKRKLRSIQ